MLSPSLIHDGRMRTSGQEQDVFRRKYELFAHRQRMHDQLVQCHVSRFAMHMPEIKYLPRIIHDNENIGGIVAGYCDGTPILLVATDHRVIYLDKKPLYFDEKEYSYDVVSGVEVRRAGIGARVTLYTRIDTVSLFTFNAGAYTQFVGYIEVRCLEGDTRTGNPRGHMPAMAT